MSEFDALPAEFALIARHFRPLAGPGAFELRDDAAVIVPPAGRELVLAADAMVAGVHFLPGDPAGFTARKLLRTNLSDLAAMGAEPLGYLLTVAVPRDTPGAWFAAFAAGLARDQVEFGLSLLGGDTTSTTGPVSLSLTILGTVPPGRALRRNGARAGDGIWVTGTVGDGALGLLAARGELADPAGFLADRYRVPQPRVALGPMLIGLAGAAIDISDGLVQDLGHLCRESGVGAVVHAAHVPLSDAARAAGAEYLGLCLTGGDDYELLLAVPETGSGALLAAAASCRVPVSRIGEFVEGAAEPNVRGADGGLLTLGGRGWDHFRA